MSDDVKEHLVRIENKIDKIDDRCDKLSVTQAEQGKDLAYHIKRTDELQDLHSKQQEHVELNTEHRQFISKTTTLFTGALVVLSTILGIIWGIMKLV